jgi:hypothetical protein
MNEGFKSIHRWNRKLVVLVAILIDTVFGDFVFFESHGVYGGSPERRPLAGDSVSGATFADFGL